MYHLLIHNSTQLPSIVFQADSNLVDFMRSGNYTLVVVEKNEYLLRKYESFYYLTLQEKDLQFKSNILYVRLFWELTKASKDTMWGFAVQNTLEHFTISRYKELVQNLYSQINDNKSLMEEMIGPKAVELICEIVKK